MFIYYANICINLYKFIYIYLLKFEYLQYNDT